MQVEWPTFLAGDALADPFPARAVSREVPVLQLHTRALCRLGDEAHLDFARLLEIGLDLPVRADVPADHDPMWRFIGEHPRPAALAAVDAAVVDMAALARFEDRLGDLDREQVVLGRLEATELLGEHRERPLDRGLDDDRGPNGCVRGLHAHETSSGRCST